MFTNRSARSHYRKKREIDTLIREAEGEGNLKEARALQKVKKQINLMIQKLAATRPLD